MKKLFVLLPFYFLYFIAACQTENKSSDFNFGFEKVSPGKELPDNWFRWGDSSYNLITDSTIKHNGEFSLLIEPKTSVSDGSFGCCAYKIPAGYDGKKIELQAFLKMENVELPVGLMLRIDGETGGLQFDNMQQKNIHGTKDWTSYSVTLPLPKEAKTIYIGFLLSGKGKLWADDFRLLIDGKEIKVAKKAKVEETIMDKDTAFSKSSGIVIHNLTDEKISDLVVLGKVWGYLKYYHPAITEGKYNWDNELFRILPKIIECKNTVDRNTILSSWIDLLGEFKTDKPEKIDTTKIKLLPDLDWINDSSILGNRLVKQLNLVKNASRKDKSFYIGMAPGVGNPQFKHERAYSQITYPDAGFSLLALYRYWNMIQYFYPNRKLMDENWNYVLKEFVPKFVNATDESAFQITTLALIAKVEDTHANIWGSYVALEKFKGTNYAPLEITFTENKAVVKDHYDIITSESDTVSLKQGKATGIQRGDVILKINDKNVEDIIKEKLPYTPASNYATQLRDIARNLLRTNDSSMNIVYIQEGIVKSATVQCFPTSKFNYSKYQQRDTCFKYLEPGIAYIYPGSIKNEFLPKVMPEFLKTKGIVIDMRCYPSEFVVFSLTEYLLPKSTAFVKFSVGSIKTPGLFTLTDNLEVGKTNNEYYKGKIVIIVNEVTQSQAEYTTMALRVAPNATVIGSTTAGADGNVSDIYLPGGLTTMISGIGIYYPDGKETQRVGIISDIEVKPTIKGIKEGKDEVLEKAIEIINGK